MVNFPSQKKLKNIQVFFILLAISRNLLKKHGLPNGAYRAIVDFLTCG